MNATLAMAILLAPIAAFGAESIPRVSVLVDVCNIQQVPQAMVGKVISIRGRVHSDIEASWLWGDACPQVFVGLQYVAPLLWSALW